MTLRLVDRIRDAYDQGFNFDLEELPYLKYEWQGHGDGSGYERFEVIFRNSSSLKHEGVYHPGDGCCKGNPCQYCGYTVHDEVE